MQLTNGALKKHLANQSVALGEKGNVVFDSEADYEELDLSAFMAPVVSKKDGQLRPSDSAAKLTEAEKFLGESESLYQLGVKYETEVVARGIKPCMSYWLQSIAWPCVLKITWLKSRSWN